MSAEDWRVGRKTYGWRDQGRPDDDYYSTPPWMIQAVLREIGFSYGAILDPGAGVGVLAGEAEEWKVQNLGEAHRPPVTVVEQDTRRCTLYPSRWDTFNEDFLAWAKDRKERYDLIVVNPPFNLWLKFADACLRLRKPGGMLLMLGTQGILASQRRYEWWQANQPSDIFQSCKRPAFRKARTDARDYVWIKWGRGSPAHTKFRWLDTTEVRNKTRDYGRKLKLPKRE